MTLVQVPHNTGGGRSRRPTPSREESLKSPLRTGGELFGDESRAQKPHGHEAEIRKIGVIDEKTGTGITVSLF